MDSVKYFKKMSEFHAYIKIPIRAKSFQDKQFRKDFKTGKMFLGKSVRTLTWEGEVSVELLKLRLETNFLKLMGTRFDPKKHCFVTIWTFAYKNSITKDGEISSKCPDIENGKKAIQDILFSIIGVDDRAALMSLDRRITCEDRMSLHIFLVDREKVS